MFSALLTPAVGGNNCELHVPAALTPEKVGLVIELPSVLVLMISRGQKTLVFAADLNLIPQTRTCDLDATPTAVSVSLKLSISQPV